MGITELYGETYFLKYRKQLKFQKQASGLIFSKALFEGLIFQRANILREICVTESIGLAYSWKEIYVLLYYFYFVLFVYFYVTLLNKHSPNPNLNVGLILKG